MPLRNWIQSRQNLGKMEKQNSSPVFVLVHAWDFHPDIIHLTFLLIQKQL